MVDKSKDVYINWLVLIDPLAYRKEELNKCSVEELEKKFNLARKMHVEEDEC